MAYTISPRGYTGEYYDYAEIVLRGTMLGLLAGGLSGAAVGTVLLPIIGTVVGAFYGTIVGGLLGLPCALVLGFVSWARPGVAATRIVSVVLALAGGGVAVLCSDVGDYGFLTYVAFPLGAVSAAVVGPRAVHRRTGRPGRLPPTEPERARL